MTNKLRDELAKSMVEGGMHMPFEDLPVSQQEVFLDYADCVINHLAPTMREVVEALESCSYHKTSYYDQYYFDEDEVQKALASLSEWQDTHPFDALRGAAPNIMDGKSSEEFIAEMRENWQEKGE